MMVVLYESVNEAIEWWNRGYYIPINDNTSSELEDKKVVSHD